MTREDLRRTLIAYDIPDDRRRARLAKVLERHGDRVQYSVFVVDSSPARLIRLRAAVQEVIVNAEDSVLFCDLGPVRLITTERFDFLGLSRPMMEHKAIVI